MVEAVERVVVEKVVKVEMKVKMLVIKEKDGVVGGGVPVTVASPAMEEAPILVERE